MELADIVASLRRHWKISACLLAASVIILGLFLVTRDQVLPETEYQATVQVLIPARDDKGIRPEGVPPVLLQGQVALALQNTTQRDAYRQAGINADDRGNVTLTAAQNDTFDIMLLSARTNDVKVASRAADAYAASYISARARTVGDGAESQVESVARAVTLYTAKIGEIEGQLRAKGVSLPRIVETSSSSSDDPAAVDTPAGATPEVAQLIVTRNYLANRIRAAQASSAQAEVEALTPSSYATVVERPAPRQVTPPKPSPLIPAAVALGLGALLAVAVPVLKDRLDHTIKDARTASAVLGAPVLSAIPATSRELSRAMARPGSIQDAAFRSLAATSVATDRLPRAIMVTSPTGHIQDIVAANFASALASLGLKVALVATAPEQSWFLNGSTNVAAAISLPDLLARAHQGGLNGEVSHQLAVSDLANLVIVPPGSSDDLELSLDGLPPLLDALERADIDVTVIAGPSLLEDPNATIFAWATRSVLWAVEVGQVTRSDAQSSADRLDLAGVVPFGVAMVGRET